jgi:general secretion pathway protein I
LFQNKHFEPRDPQGDDGFTLIEALVALAVTAVCLTAIATLMAQNIRASRQIDQRVALVSVLRKVATAMPDRPDLMGVDLAGEMAGQRWAVSAAPFPDPAPPQPGKAAPQWMPQAIIVSARSPSGSLVKVETLRLVPRPRAAK